MCALTMGLLLFPGGPLDSLWRLNSEAHSAFQWIGRSSILLMAIVGAMSLARRGGLIQPQANRNETETSNQQ